MMQRDRVGEWSERKLEILGEYVAAYTKVMKNRTFRKYYIDAFSGCGEHLSKDNGQLIPGSPLRALLIEPPFDEYHFIDMDCGKIDELRNTVKRTGKNVYFYNNDCNDLLCDELFPSIRYKEYKRAFCFLDPYGLSLEWRVFKKAAEMKTIEILLNFALMDVNRNCVPKNPQNINDVQKSRLTRFWGDESWLHAAYTSEPNLFGVAQVKSKYPVLMDAFCKRLRNDAHFKFVPEPLLMCNRKGAPLYYLVFASNNDKGFKIMSDIFKKYR